MRKKAATYTVEKVPRTMPIGTKTEGAAKESAR